MSQVSLSFMAVIVFGWFLGVAESILLPILLGALLAFLLDGMAAAIGRTPVVGPMLPHIVRLGISVVVAFALFLFAIGLFALNMEPVVREMPAYVEAVSSLVNTAASQFGYDIQITWQSIQRLLFANVDLQFMIRYAVNSFSYSAGYLGLVFIYSLFFLLEKKHADNKLAALFPEPAMQARARDLLNQVGTQIGTYFTMKTLVNGVLGLACWAVLAVFGIEFAAFWAILTAIFNYIPYVGTWFAIALPILVSIGQYESPATTFALFGFLALVQFIIGYAWEPRLLGKSLNLSPLVIMISLATWAALWGIPGAMLSVILTSTVAIILSAFHTTRPLAALMQEDPLSGEHLFLFEDTPEDQTAS